MRKLLSILLVALLIAPMLTIPPAAASGYDTQTIMIYLVGTDLESRSGLATDDITEMLRSRFDTSRIKVLIMTGGTKEWANDLISPKQLGIYLLESRNPKLVWHEPPRNMGDPETLSFFLNYAVEHYPADSYGLILWDHGGGPMVGFGWDELHGRDMLTMPELQRALRNSPFQEEKRMEWLAFDACLMATVEVGALMRPHARYLISSEELLPGAGFDYKFLGKLGDTSLRGDEVARHIIDSTFDYYTKLWTARPERRMSVTLSLTDLDRIPQVEQAVDALFSDLQHGLNLRLYSQMARFRDASKVYGIYGTTNDYDLVDLSDLAKQMARLYPEEAKQVQEAVQEAVLYNRSNVSRSDGLSIYFPFKSKPSYEKAWRDLYTRFDILPAYRAFMDHFGKVLLSESLSNWLGDDAPPVVYDEVSDSYFIQLSPEQLEHYDRAEYYVLAHVGGDQYALTFMSSDVSLDDEGRLKANFGGNVLYISDDKTEPMPLPYLREIDSQNGIVTYHIPALLERRLTDGTYESVGATLLAELDKRSGSAVLIGAIRDEDAENMLGKRDLDLDDWEVVNLIYLSMYLTRGESGDPLVLGDWVTSDDLSIMSLRTADWPRLSYAPLNTEENAYSIMISVVDTQDYAYPSELMPLSTGPEEPQPPARPAATRVEHPMDPQQPSVLYKDEELQITLTEIGFRAHELADRRAPDTLLLTMMAENLGNHPIQVDLSWLSINGLMLPAQFSQSLDPGRSFLESVEVPIAPQPDGMGLVDHDIRLVEDIRFRFGIRVADGTLMSPARLTPEIHMHTSVPVGAGFDTPDREEPEARTLSDTEGMLIELMGPPTLADGQLALQLRVTNNGEHLDTLAIAESSVNGIMARLQLEQQYAMPGSVLHTRAFIPLGPPEIPPELEPYREHFELEDYLQKYGIVTPAAIRLRFELSAQHDQGGGGWQPVARTPYVDIDVPGGEGHEQALDKQGTELLSQGGLTIIRLDSDESGRTLYLHNGTDKSLRLNSSGHVYVDEQLYAANYPIRLNLAPGTSAYHKLFSFLPGLQPEGRQMRFLLSVIDPDENLLLFRTDYLHLELH